MIWALIILGLLVAGLILWDMFSTKNPDEDDE